MHSLSLQEYSFYGKTYTSAIAERNRHSMAAVRKYNKQTYTMYYSRPAVVFSRHEARHKQAKP